MTEKKARKRANPQDYMPEAEEVARELSKAGSMDDFFGKEGIFARLFANTLEQMLEEELTDQLGYEPYEVKGKAQLREQPEWSLQQEGAHLRRGHPHPGAARPEWRL
jgi:hypothetical protein